MSSSLFNAIRYEFLKNIVIFPPNDNRFLNFVLNVINLYTFI